MRKVNRFEFKGVILLKKWLKRFAEKSKTLSCSRKSWKLWAGWREAWHMISTTF